MTKNILFTATILLMVASAALAGRITPWADPDLVYPNTGRVSYMNLYFTLDNRLPAGHLMRIALPFAANPTFASNAAAVYAAPLSKGAFVTSTISSLTAVATSTTLKTNTTGAINNYFAFSADLTAGTNYVMRLTFGATISDAAGFIGHIQIETMSPSYSIMNSPATANDTAITYDANNAFAPVQLFPAPGNFTSFNITSDANNLTAGQSSVRQFSLAPSANFFYWPMIQISWDNTNFTISNVVNVDSGNTTALTVGTGSFQYAIQSQTTTSVSILHNLPMVTSQVTKYNLTTANPSTQQTITFTVRIMHRYNMNVTDIITASGITVTPASSSSSTTVAQAINGYNILLSWGVDPTAVPSSTSLSKVFALYASPITNKLYQGVRWVFGTNGTWPTALYQVQVVICSNGSNCDILENSLVSNMTQSSCVYNFPTTAGGAKSITCNTTTFAATGNSLGGRIWLYGSTTASTGVIAAANVGTFPTTTTETNFGLITILTYNSVANTFANTTSTALASGYTTTFNYNNQLLVNINGNGPLLGMPISGNTPATTSTYAQLWNGAAVTGASAAPAGFLGTSSPTSFPIYAYSATATQPLPVVSQMYGGIYGINGTSANKYNLALFTTGSIAAATTNIFKATATGSAGSALTAALPGVDVFMNPNVFSNAVSASGSSIIASCWLGNLPTKPAISSGTSTTNFASFTADATAGTAQLGANCYTNQVTTTNANYLRLRWVAATGNANAFASIGGGGAATTAASTGIDTTYTSSGTKNQPMTFFWESAVNVVAWNGSSLQPGAQLTDFYAVFYSLTLASGVTTPTPYIFRSGNSSAADVGELGATVGSAQYAVTIGTPCMWHQMIMGPYGGAYGGAAVVSDYFNKKQVFISGYSTATTAYTTSQAVSLLRVRGSIASTGVDQGLNPNSGKIALFIGAVFTTAALPVIEPLGATNTTTAAGVAGYNTQVGGSSLVGAANIRCWNNGALGLCTQDRYGRAMTAVPYATMVVGSPAVLGNTNNLDLYTVLTSNAPSTSNFSIAFLIKPLVSTASPAVTLSSASYVYRFGFAVGYTYYIQSWDQPFDNAATIDSTAFTIKNIGATLPTSSAAQYPSATNCTWTVAASGNTYLPGVRLQVNAADTVNAAASALVNLTIGVGGTGSITTTSSSSFQGQTLWCATWNFAQTLSAISSTTLENSGNADKCVTFDYLAAESTSTSPINFYCVYCPIANPSVTISTSASAIVNLTNLYDGPAVNIPTTYTVYSNLVSDNGPLLENSNCAGVINTANIWQPQTITITAAPSSMYNVSGQKLTIGFTAPSGLNTAVADTIYFNGKTSSGADTAFPYGSLDTNYVCRLVPQSSSSNYAAYIPCTATNASGLLTITTGTNGNAAITGTTATQWYLYIWGFNGQSTLGTATNALYVMQTAKTNSTFIVDQSANASASAYAQWGLSNGTTSIAFNTPTYQRPMVGARGWLRFDIAMTGRTWFYNDKVVINLDAIASATINNNASVVKCRVTDSSDNMFYGFQSCTFTSGSAPTVTLLGLTPSTTVNPFEIVTGSGIRVYLDNMVTMSPTSNKTIYGNVYFTGVGSTVGSATLTKVGNVANDVNPYNLTLGTFSATPVISKFWASANHVQETLFSWTSSGAFNSSCRITIVFPSYYNPGLTTRSASPYCTVNGVYSQCVVGQLTVASTSITNNVQNGLRQLVIYGSSASVAANGALLVRVSGISAPPANYTAENFWIQVNGDNSESNTTLINAGAVVDPSFVTQSPSILPIQVVWSGVGSTATRSLTTFTWSLYLNTSITVNVSSAVQVVFPESWGLAWGEFTPTCQVGDFTNNATTYTAAISGTTGNNAIFGNLVTMNVSTAIPNGSVFNVTCSNVRTPSIDGYYRPQEVTFRIVDASGSLVWFRSQPGVHNVNFTAMFAKQTSQVYASWAVATTTSAAGTLASPGPLTAGTFNLPVRITVPSSSSRSFIVTLSNSNFGFLTTASPFWLTTGNTANSTLLGCAQSVAIGVYAINTVITPTDNSTTYLAPAPLYVAVNNNVQIITPTPTGLSIYFLAASTTSTSAPVVFDLTNNPPYSDITITPVAPSNNNNFTFSPSSIKITPANPKAYFTFSTTSSATATGSASFTFTVSGTNAASYSVGTTAVTIQLTADTGSGATNAPTLTVAADSSDTSLPTTKVVAFTLGSVAQATVYYSVALQGQQITDGTALAANGAALTQYNPSSANQAQYFTTYMTTTSKTGVSISNLYPNTGYVVTAIAVSQTNKNSSVAQFQFITGSNAAPVQRWLFNYTAGTYPSAAARQSLLCTITQSLAVPAVNVRTVHGEICGNTSAFYTTPNTTTGDLGVYFYPLQANVDTTMTTVNLQAVLNISSFNQTLSNAASGAAYQSIMPVDIPYVPRQAPNVTIPSSISSSAITAASISVALSSINETGFLFVAVCSNTSTAPTAIQMKQAAANLSTITGLINLQVLYYYPGAVPSYNFTGLTAATSYNVYVAASNNDPSFLQNFTAVNTIAVSTSSTGSTGSSGSGQMGVMMSVMAVFASIISLMFF